MSETKKWGNVPVERLLECPKTMTNGPCGGVGLDGSCEVDRSKLCVWHESLNQASSPEVYRRVPVADWSGNGANWANTFAEDKIAPPPQIANFADKNRRPLRCGSRFERLLRQGEFVVTCEVNPHDSADAAAIIEYAKTLAGHIDAAHISDNSLAQPHMCGLAVAALIQNVGIEPILHLTCRDRNRLMLQADLLGAHALGVRNVLCLTGDHPRLGDHPTAKAVFDLDSITFTAMTRKMRDEGRFESGERALDVKPQFFIGGAVGITAPPLEFRPHRLVKKIDAGLDFAISQLIFDMDMLREFMKRFRDMGLDEKIHLLIGVGALHNPNQCRYINANTPGVVIPESIINRLNGVPPNERKKEGVKIVVEQIQELREMPGIYGVDIMDLDPRRWFPTVEIVEAAGLQHRPALAAVNS